MHTKVNRGILMAAALVCAAAGLARAQYETDTLPPGVTPRGGTGVGGVATPAPTPPDRTAPVVPQPLPSASPPAGPEIAPTLPSGGSVDAVARFLAGRRLPGGTRLAQLQSERWYLDHAGAFAGTWRRFDALYFSKMRQWSASELIPRVGSVETVFYLFGGPDFINAFALFPEARTMILGGLEPVGSVPEPAVLDGDRIQAALAGLRDSTDVTLQFSHFITKDMKVELEKTDFKGVLPILLAFASLGGAEILDVRPVGITATGDLVAADAGRGLLPGVQIDFRRGSDLPVQTIFYVQADVSDGGLRANPGLLRWMKRFAPGVSYLKAASYLMHESYFSLVRSFLLNESRAILQDDSGIPLRYFASGDWRITLFGRYTGTLEIFRKYYQSDLASSFNGAMPVSPLSFGTGYKWQVGESNLMLAVRGTSLPVAPPAAEVSPAQSSPPTLRGPVVY